MFKEPSGKRSQTGSLYFLKKVGKKKKISGEKMDPVLA